MRSSPKPPDRLTVERRLNVRPPAAIVVVWLFCVVPDELEPFMGASAPSRQKLADMPPPRSSTPRKPMRLDELAEGLRPLMRPALVLTFSYARSTTPNSVTDDWAKAALVAASAAKAIRVFFMQVSPRLNIGLRCSGVTNDGQHRVLPPDPRANLLLGSWPYCTRAAFGAQSI